MAAVIISISFPIQTFNTSVQEGDNIYYSCTGDFVFEGGFQTTNTPSFLGKVMSLERLVEFVTIDVMLKEPELAGCCITNAFNEASGLDIPIPFDPLCGMAYFSFSKSGIVNQNELIGYYSQVQFVNDSNVRAELFAVGTEVHENSK